MRKNYIYQIFYNQQTKALRDPGFIPLDNSSNSRPDWSEYWPIRKFLLDEKLSTDGYYAFFSPKFKEKTGLDSSQVFNYLNDSVEDIVAFSPYFDQSAFFLNIFEQGSSNHINIQTCFQESFNLINPHLNLNNIVTTSRNSIFCNFFAAKRHVWLEWLDCCEKLFNISEDNNSELAKLLNQSVNHASDQNPSKVFVIERMISFLIFSNINWSVRSYSPIELPFSNAPISSFRSELIILDALKISFAITGIHDYIKLFMHIRSEIISQIVSSK